MNRTFISLVALAASLGLPHGAAAQDASSFCATGFAVADQDGDGVLRMEETEALQGAEFDALDADGDGLVQREEYRDCLSGALARPAAPREVDWAGSGELGPSGVEVDFQTTGDGAITRDAYMDAARLAYDGTGNQEDNQVEWARAFVFLGEGEADSDILDMGRDEYAARASMMFRRLDADGDAELSPEEWTAAEVPQIDVTESVDAMFDRADADASDDLTRDEYLAAGTARRSAAADAARARGWDETDATMSAGIDTEAADGASESAVTTGGLVGDGNEGTVEDVAAAGEAPDPGIEDGAETEGAEDSPVVTDMAGGADDEIADADASGVPAFEYRFAE